jgi:glycosyltransferase involved in cell wall biosynthesis
MEKYTVLYDGWPLIYAPNSSPALHLLTLLAYSPEESRPVVALPAPPPDWFPAWAAALVRPAAQVRPTANTPRGRLAWEQRLLPWLREEIGAALLHHTASTPPLFGRAASVVSPSEESDARQERRQIFSRLREAVSDGGMARLRALFWPSDLPESETAGPLVRLPPVAYPGFYGQADYEAPLELDLPETFVLYHGPAGEPTLRRLLEAWSWAAGSLGEYYPLLALGLSPAEGQRLMALAEAYELEKLAHVPVIPPGAIPAVYRRAAVIFHPAPAAPWGSPLRHALACGRPIVALEDRRIDALVGPAAYLVPDQPDKNARALGAALVTVIVEESVGAALGAAARQRAAAWDGQDFSQALGEAYNGLQK